LLSFHAVSFIFQFTLHYIKIKIYGTISVLLFCMGEKPGALLKKVHRLAVLENRELRMMFGSMTEEVTRD